MLLKRAMVTKVKIQIQDQDVVEMEVGTSGLSACNHSFNSPTASVCSIVYLVHPTIWCERIKLISVLVVRFSFDNFVRLDV